MLANKVYKKFSLFFRLRCIDRLLIDSLEKIKTFLFFFIVIYAKLFLTKWLRFTKLCRWVEMLSIFERQTGNIVIIFSTVILTIGETLIIFNKTNFIPIFNDKDQA